ncbi:MAG: DMT family transporter [Patescibacteria group bacterium]
MMNKGLFLVLGTAIISGVSIFINQFGVKMVNPYIFTGLKNIVVVVLILGLLLFIKEFKNLKKLSKKDWLRLLIIGFVGGSIPFLMFFKGLSMTTGPEASYIHKFLFIVIALLAPLFLKEKWNWQYLIGLGALFIGGVMLFQVNGFFTWNSGNLLILGATILWSIENIISKKAVAKISPRIVALGRMGFGSLFIVLFWIFTNQIDLVATLDVKQFWWVALTGLLLFGYVTTWYTGLKYIPLTYAAAILALGAPITALLQLMQGQEFATTQIWGMSIMFTGALFFVIADKYICSHSRTQLNTQ